MEHQAVLLTIVAVVAFIGNTLTVMLFAKKSKWLKKTYNCLILALAVQDIFVAICLMAFPGFVMNGDAYRLPAGETAKLMYCKIIWSQFIPFALGIASVYTCLMLTFDRWLAVVKPLSYKRYEQSTTVVVLTVFFPWIAGFSFEITSPLNATPTEVNSTSICGWKRQEYTSKTVFLAVFTFLGMLIVPAALMVFAYHRIIVQMKKSQNRISVVTKSSVVNSQAGSALRSLKRVTLTAFFASTVVIVCWLPDQLYYALSQVHVTELGTSAHFVVKILAFASSCVNPVIYCFSNNSYRHGLKEMFGFFPCCAIQSLPSEFSMAERSKT